jgi:hypothetical protein
MAFCMQAGGCHYFRQEAVPAFSFLTCCHIANVHLLGLKRDEKNSQVDRLLFIHPSTP